MADSLEVIDDMGNVLRTATRKEIHENGLLHREVHVFLYTPEGNVIFQKRDEKNGDFPNLLDVAIGGHVDVGETYEQAAIREAEEEAGLKISAQDLELVELLRYSSANQFKIVNNVIRAEYIMRYNGKLKDLRVEEGKASCFEEWPVDKMGHLSEAEKQKFLPYILTADGQRVYNAIKERVSKK